MLAVTDSLSRAAPSTTSAVREDYNPARFDTTVRILRARTTLDRVPTSSASGEAVTPSVWSQPLYRALIIVVSACGGLLLIIALAFLYLRLRRHRRPNGGISQDEKRWRGHQHTPSQTALLPAGQHGVPLTPSSLQRSRYDRGLPRPPATLISDPRPVPMSPWASLEEAMRHDPYHPAGSPPMTHPWASPRSPYSINGPYVPPRPWESPTFYTDPASARPWPTTMPSPTSQRLLAQEPTDLDSRIDPSMDGYARHRKRRRHGRRRKSRTLTMVSGLTNWLMAVPFVEGRGSERGGGAY